MEFGKVSKGKKADGWMIAECYQVILKLLAESKWVACWDWDNDYGCRRSIPHWRANIPGIWVIWELLLLLSTFPSEPKQWEVKLFGKLEVFPIFVDLFMKRTPGLWSWNKQPSTFVAYIPRHAKHWWKEIWVHLQLLGHVVDRLVNFERWFKTSEKMGSFSAGKTGGFLSLASSCFWLPWSGKQT